MLLTDIVPLFLCFDLFLYEFFVFIIFMWFFNKTLFILSSIILTGGGAVWVSLSAGCMWTGQSVASSGELAGVQSHH